MSGTSSRQTSSPAEQAEHEKRFLTPFLPPARVAYLCEFPTLLGGERSLLAFLDHAPAAGIDPIVVAPAEGRLAAALREREIPHVPWSARGRHAAKNLGPSLRAHGVRIVHGNSLMVGEAALVAARELDVPAVTHVRDIMTLSRARVDRLNELDAIVCVSKAVRQALVEQGVREPNTVVVPNAVDPQALRDAANGDAVRSELALDPGTALVGCAGQIALRKGQDLFVEAAAEIASRRPDVHFAIAGERYSRKPESERFEAELRERSDAPPLAGRVHWLGYRTDAPSVLAALDILVVPSRQEPLSRVLLEALALGVPAVATDVGGMREIVEDGETGAIVSAGDPLAIASSVTNLLDSQELRARHRELGPKRAAWFSPNRQVRALRELYAGVLASTV